VNARESLFACLRYRTDDARFDAACEDANLRELGVIEDDQPTEYSHYAYMERFEREATGDFTPAERIEIRTALGLGPFGSDPS
jgi:hypothetical protein